MEKNKNKKFGTKKVLFSAITLGLISAFGFIALLSNCDNPLQAAEIIDTDGDGYDDEAEIASGYSPFNPAPEKIKESDVDADGLSDYFEIEFGTDPFNPDTDNDGYSDSEEIDWAYDPNSAEPKRLDRKIEIDLANQRLTLLVSGRAWKDFPVSTGKPSMPTPTGAFKIINKIENAWSKSYGLWMPYWLGLDRGRIGIHELPVWPGGYREGEDHLGHPVSHGCIRLGVGPAQYLYERVEAGTEVVIK
ncbi:MAG: L,D-transpeptidase family protein [Patescibacteria group bacterium]